MLDADTCLLQALGHVGREMLSDLLVETSLEAILRPVSEDTERAVGQGGSGVLHSR